jgi:flavin-dependent dehydrogenase
VAIAGGGPAGCATALALVRGGVTNVLLADVAARRAARRIGESIPPDTRRLLHRLGVLERFLADAHEPCLGSCSSWGTDDLGYNDFLFNPLGTGWHLDRQRFDAMLLDGVRAAGVDVRQTRFDLHDPPPARVTVDATGTQSVVARSRGARRVVLDGLICVTGFFATSDTAPLNRLTLLEAVDEGWWYAARVPNGEIVVAFASDVETIRRLDATRPTNWQAMFATTRHLAPALADCPFLEETLRSSHAPSFILDRTAGQGWLAAGDAASAYDPISAGGIYKALDDGLRAADAIIATLGGSRTAMDSYHQSVRTRFDGYAANRNYFYAVEQRFPKSPFWNRRRAATSQAADRRAWYSSAAPPSP